MHGNRRHDFKYPISATKHEKTMSSRKRVLNISSDSEDNTPKPPKKQPTNTNQTSISSRPPPRPPTNRSTEPIDLTRAPTATMATKDDDVQIKTFLSPRFAAFPEPIAREVLRLYTATFRDAVAHLRAGTVSNLPALSSLRVRHC
jgi:hypothetical protein